MTTSHFCAFNVLRRNPRRCANHVYSMRLPRSRASSAAILFSKPSPFELVNGRLFGSAQTRNGSEGLAPRTRGKTTTKHTKHTKHTKKHKLILRDLRDLRGFILRVLRAKATRRCRACRPRSWPEANRASR